VPSVATACTGRTAGRGRLQRAAGPRDACGSILWPALFEQERSAFQAATGDTATPIAISAMLVLKVIAVISHYGATHPVAISRPG
jgi:hypothetical protein